MNLKINLYEKRLEIVLSGLLKPNKTLYNLKHFLAKMLLSPTPGICSRPIEIDNKMGLEDKQ